jgi:DNA topoisomerase-6 subunit B
MSCLKFPMRQSPHPHTMKLGEFIAHSHLFGRVKVDAWLKKGFSRVSDTTITEISKNKNIQKSLLSKNVDQLNEADFKALFMALQSIELMAPSTKSVLSIGEEAFEKSIGRLGEVDFFFGRLP